MNIFEIFREDLAKIAGSMDKKGIVTNNNFSVEQPKNVKFGDLSTNIAIVSAKLNNTKPVQLAEHYCSAIKDLAYVKDISIDGPGFINIFLQEDILYQVMHKILEQGPKFGESNLGAGKKVNIEYVSANPSGPMHIGHARGACFGDSLANVLKKTGHEVTKEYYINDAGRQIDVLADSVYLRYLESLGEKIEIPSGYYPGEYLIEVGDKLKAKYGDQLKDLSEQERRDIIKPFALQEMMRLIKQDLSDLAIFHDVFTSELKLNEDGIVKKGIELLQGKGLLYRGVLEKPKGKQIDDWEEKEQLIFKSTSFGDDQDRVVVKSDGSNTYFAGDIGYALDKINRGFTDIIYVLGADHAGYVKRLKSIVSAISDNKVEADVKICQLVHFMENNEVLKMSKRAGTFVTVGDVIKLVGADVIRIMMLTRKNDISLNFDISLVKEQSKDNPVFYIQYAHARAKSIFRQAENECKEALEAFNTGNINLSLLNSEEELNLIKVLASWPRILEQAAIHHEPHRAIFYVIELAGEFHSLWAKGRDNKDLKFIITDKPDVTAARLAIAKAVANVVASALEICNVIPLDEM